MQVQSLSLHTASTPGLGQRSNIISESSHGVNEINGNGA